jgi:hypothetical protein
VSDGELPWPSTYQERLRVIESLMERLRRRLGPLQDAVRAFRVLGGEVLPNLAERRWTLPAGATLAIRAGYDLHVDLGGIGKGVIPEPDPLVCLASALSTEDMWRGACAVFLAALAWCAEQAAEWEIPADPDLEASA